MNKYLFILGIVGTALLSACSSDDLTMVLSPDEEEAIVVKAGQDSDVPIALGVGTGRAITRKPLNSEEGLFVTPNGQYLGVYCLATGIQEGAPTIKNVIPTTDEDVKWNGSCRYANWLNNVPAKVTTDGSTSAVTFEKECYYPFGNWYHYDFFAYYPRQEQADPEGGPYAIGTHTFARSCYVVFEIDGKQDIIWGKTTLPATDATDAFSSKYFREHDLADAPQYTFNHLLTQLEFHLKPFEDDITKLSEYKLTDVKLTNVYNHLLLWIACKTEDTHTAGTLEPIGSKTETGIKVWNSDDTDPFDGGAEIAVVPTLPATETLVCYAMLRPKDISGMKVHIKMKKSGGEEIERDITLSSPEGGFNAGSKYKVNIDLKK